MKYYQIGQSLFENVTSRLVLSLIKALLVSDVEMLHRNAAQFSIIEMIKDPECHLEYADWEGNGLIFLRKYQGLSFYSIR